MPAYSRKAAQCRTSRFDRALPFSLPNRMSSKETKAFIAEHGCGTPATIDFLCRTNLRLITYGLKIMEKKYTCLPLGLDAEDLVQEGFLALRRAAERYDPSRGTEFSTYAVFCIKNQMRSTIRRAHRRREVFLACD